MTPFTFAPLRGQPSALKCWTSSTPITVAIAAETALNAILVLRDLAIASNVSITVVIGRQRPKRDANRQRE